MATTLQIPSFADINLRERTTLETAAAANDASIAVKNSAGFDTSQTVYVGTPGQDSCEAVVIQALTDATHLALASGLKLSHARFEPVVGVIGDTVRIYRAANVDGSTPADADFALLTSRSIDADQPTTYYTDSDGSSDYWYKFTYYNATTDTETDLSAAVAVRGDDYGHYASLSEIRNDAGFKYAYNLDDELIDQKRRQAEAEINDTLSNVYVLPFATVPERVRTLTIQLAAGLLESAVYPVMGKTDDDNPKVKSARRQLAELAAGSAELSDAEGVIASGEGAVSSYPYADSSDGAERRGDGSNDRLFHIGDVY